MQNDTLYSGQEARGGLIAGIRKCSRAVGITMGSSGTNSIIEDIHIPGYRLLNDGATILESIRLADPIEELGRKILVEATSRSNKASGDGSSTTVVLTHAIIEEGLKHLDQGTSAMDIKRSLESCIPLIEESINKQKRNITVDEVAAVASISAEDEGIGQRIQEIYQQIGKEGIIHWDVSKTIEDSYTIGKGITVDGATYISPYMCDASENGQNTNQIRIKDPKILITKQKIASASEFNEIGQVLFNKEIRDLIVFCDEVDPLVIPDIVKTRMVRGFRFILVKMPTLWKGEWYADLALASGAKVAGPDYPLKNIKAEDLGTFDNILITKDATYIDGIKDLTTHIQELETEATDDSKLRASRLNTKTARYFVGGISDSAISHRRYKVEDAIASAYHSLHGGIVAGGGVALDQSTCELKDSVGEKILKVALQAPQVQIMRNAGITSWGAPGPYSNIGVDSRTKQQVNMFDAKIIDSATITMNAVRNAISVAASILTAETLVLLPRETQTQGNPAQII